MNKLKIASYSLLIISIAMIVYAILFNPANWIVYAVAIVFIPIFILSFGLITMAKPRKDEEEERKEEPFIGY